jgi:hypothetical protein
MSQSNQPELDQTKIDTLVEALDALPQVPGWEGVRQNASVGYYQTVPANNLALDIRGLTFEEQQHTDAAEALAVRAANGEFS